MLTAAPVAMGWHRKILNRGVTQTHIFKSPPLETM